LRPIFKSYRTVNRSEKRAFLMGLAAARVIRASPRPGSVTFRRSATLLSFSPHPFFFRPCRWRPSPASAPLPLLSNPFRIALCSPLTRRFSPASADLSHCVLLSFLRSGGTLRRSPGPRLAPLGLGEWRRGLHCRWDEGAHCVRVRGRCGSWWVRGW
jgi:hypothetical protein